jgi:hypothetical protein
MMTSIICRYSHLKMGVFRTNRIFSAVSFQAPSRGVIPLQL